MTDFDQAARYLVRLNPDGFFGWLVPKYAERFRFLRWLESDVPPYPGEPRRVPDCVAEFAPRDDADGQRRLMDVEFQSEPDYEIVDRGGEYIFRLRRAVRYGPGNAGKYQVQIVIVNMTGPPQSGELDQTEPELDGDGAKLKLRIRALREESAPELVADVASGKFERCVLPWVPLLNGGEQEDIITEWIRLVLEEPDERSKRGYFAIALVFANLAKRAAVWRKHLEPLMVQRSEIVDEWRMEGEIARVKQDIRRFVRGRFGASMPSELEEQIDSQDNISTLEMWVDAVAEAESLDDFRTRIAPPASDS